VNGNPILDAHLRLDEAIEDALCAVAGDTESSALAVIQQVRLLHDAAQKMAAYLAGSALEPGDLGKEIEDLSRDIAEVLGQIQYQDVVRQCIDRIRVAMRRRNSLLQELSGIAAEELPQVAGFPQQLEMILQEFLTEEDRHRHSSRQTSAQSGELKIELF